jgi:DnaJ like chaperone protein
MAIAGKLIGALIGSIAGPLGTIFGGLIGHLIDTAAEERRWAGPGARITGDPDLGSASDQAGASDPVAQAQVNFLACLIGLSLVVAETDVGVRPSHLSAMKEFFRKNFSFPSVDQELLRRLIDEMYANRRRIDVPGLCAYYAAVSTVEGRLLLLRLLFQIARSDARGVSAAEEDRILRIALLLGVDERGFRQVRAEFTGNGGRAWEILGVSPDADIEQIKSAYRQMALQNHPDRVANLGPELVKVAEEKFKAIQEAYEEIRRQKGF